MTRRTLPVISAYRLGITGGSLFLLCVPFTAHNSSLAVSPFDLTTGYGITTIEAKLIDTQGYGQRDEPENIAYQRGAPWNNSLQRVPVTCAVNGTQYDIFSFHSSINKEQAVACYSKALRA